MRFGSFLVIIACVVLLCQGALAGAAPRTLDRNLDPVILTGQKLSSFAQAPLGQLFVYAYQGSAWRQIPWQFDEVQGGKIVASEDNLLDNDDQLVFMAADTGEQAPAAAWIGDASSRQYPRYELAVSDPINPSKQGWVYVYRSATLTCTVTQDYASFDTAQYAVRTSQYVLGLLLRKIGVDRLEMNGSGIDILDRTKIRVAVPGFGTYSEDSDILATPLPTLVKDGPVRVVAALRSNGLEPVHVIGYRALFQYALDLSLPLSLSSLRISADQTAAASGSTYYDANATAGVTVDGRPDSVPASPATRWFQVSGTTGTAFLTVDYSAAGTANTYYKDDATVDAADTGDKMSYGDAGVLLTNPGHSVSLTLTGYILPPSQPRVGPTYLAYVQQPLQTQATEQLAAGTPSVTTSPTRTPTVTATPTRTPPGAHTYRTFLPVVLKP
jgi:hypothetical protein